MTPLISIRAVLLALSQCWLYRDPNAGCEWALSQNLLAILLSAINRLFTFRSEVLFENKTNKTSWENPVFGKNWEFDCSRNKPSKKYPSALYLRIMVITILRIHIYIQFIKIISILFIFVDGMLKSDWCGTCRLYLGVNKSMLLHISQFHLRFSLSIAILASHIWASLHWSFHLYWCPKVVQNVDVYVNNKKFFCMIWSYVEPFLLLYPVCCLWTMFRIILSKVVGLSSTIHIY